MAGCDSRPIPANSRCGTPPTDRRKRLCRFLPYSSRPTFNHLSITSTSGTAAMASTATMAVNRHPMWSDKSGVHASPWIGLSSLDERRPLFRNLKLTGRPVIPRAVRLADGDVLRGWQSQVFADIKTSETTEAGKAANAGWRLAGGVIHAPGLDSDAIRQPRTSAVLSTSTARRRDNQLQSSSPSGE